MGEILASFLEFKLTSFENNSYNYFSNLFFPQIISISDTRFSDRWPRCCIQFLVQFISVSLWYCMPCNVSNVSCVPAHIFGSCVQHFSWYMLGHRLTEDVGYSIPVTLFTVNFYSFCCSASGALSNSGKGQEKLICV